MTNEKRSGAASYDIAYAYDSVDNRLTKDDGTDVTTFTYDAANRLGHSEVTAGRTTYDNDGNQLTKEEPSGDLTTNTWDYENKITPVNRLRS